MENKRFYSAFNPTPRRVGRGDIKRAGRQGQVYREQFNEIPPHVEYSLTERGRDLMPVFYEIMKWGFKHETDASVDGEAGTTSPS